MKFRLESANSGKYTLGAGYLSTAAERSTASSAILRRISLTSLTLVPYATGTKTVILSRVSGRA